MTDIQQLVDGYIAIWNETDEAKRQKLIEQIWTPNASYVDPLAQVAGYDGINALIAGVHAQFPGSKFRRTGAIDAHHNCVRFGWEMAFQGQSAFAGGIDIGHIENEKLQSIVSFLDFAPSA